MTLRDGLPMHFSHLLLGLLVIAAAPAAAVDGIDAALAECRTALAARLQAGTAGGAPVEIVLECAGALRHHGHYVQSTKTGVEQRSMIVRLVHTGTGWDGLTIGTDNDDLRSRLLVAGIDANGLSFADGRLSGPLRLQLGRQRPGREMDANENSHSMLKAARVPTTDWWIGGLARVLPHPQVVTVEVAVQPGNRRLELQVEALAGDERPAAPPAADDRTPITWDDLAPRLPRQRSPVTLVLHHDAKGWATEPAFAPQWNRALHIVDPTGLSFAGDRLTGTLVVTLQPDAWVPTPRVPRRLVLTLDADVSQGVIATSATVSGDQGEYRVAVTGSVWTELTGTYRTEGLDGTGDGRVIGRLRPCPTTPADHHALTAPPATAGHEVAEAWRSLNAHLVAVRDFPQPVDAGLATALKPERPTPATAAAWSASLAAWAPQAAPVPPARGNVLPDDPEFGPYEVAEMLQSGPDGRITLPAATAPSAWRQLAGWQVIGPFVGDEHDGGQQGPLALPAIAPDPAITYLDRRHRLAADVEVELRWQASPPGEMVRPPDTDAAAIWVADGKLSSYSAHPVERAYRACEADARNYDWYATAVLQADAERTVWLGIQAIDFAQLWLDGRLVWESGPVYNSWMPAVLPITLRAGPNVLLVRCGKHRIGYHPPPDHEASGFRCWLGTGQPRENAAPTTADTVPVDAAPPAGRHAPGARRWPDADPPLAWDLERKINLRWRTAVPPAAASPVVHGERLFVTVEPHELRCLDATTGALRWSRMANVLALANDPAVRALADRFADFVAASRRCGELSNTINSLRGDLRTATGDDQALGQEQLAAREAELAALNDEWRDVVKQLAQRGLLSGSRLAALGSRAGAVPVVTDDGCWTSYGTGVVAAYDPDGRERWVVATGLPWTGGEEFSPLLLDGALLLGAPLPRRPGGKGEFTVLALDAATGQERWRSAPLNGTFGGLAPVRCGDIWLLALADGRLLDAADGAVRRERTVSFLSPGVNGSVPYTLGDTVYFTDGTGQAAVRCWSERPGSVACRARWDIHRGGHGGSLPVVHDGRFHVPRIADEFHPHNVVNWVQLDVYDARAGHQLAKPKPVTQPALAPGPLTIAGDHLLYVDHGTAQWAKDPRAHLVVLDTSERPAVMMDNEFASDTRLYGSPAVAGSRLFLRLGNEVICLEVTDAAGREYAEKALAETTLRAIGDRPPPIEVVEPVPLAAAADPAAVPVTRIVSGVGAQGWLLAGPLPLTDGDPVAALGGPGAAIVRGTTFTWEGADRRFLDLPAEFLPRNGAVQTFLDQGTFYTPRYAIDFLGIVGRQVRQRLLLATVLRTAEPRTMLFTLRGLPGKVWFGGQPMEDGTPVRLAPGDYPLLLQVDVKSIPPIGMPLISAVPVRCDDPLIAQREWRDRIRRHRGRLERIRERLPDDPLALIADKLLAELAADR